MTRNGWQKQPCGWEWVKSEPGIYRAGIDKVSGTGTGKPYLWAVYRLPRPIAERWMPVAKGSCAKLAEAKAMADAAIAAFNGEQA